jgi:hypothetical protein
LWRNPFTGLFECFGELRQVNTTETFLPGCWCHVLIIILLGTNKSESSRLVGSKCSKYGSVSPKLTKHTKLNCDCDYDPRDDFVLLFGPVETTNKFLVPIQPSLAPGVASEQVLDLFVYTCDNLEDFTMKWE